MRRRAWSEVLDHLGLVPGWLTNLVLTTYSTGCLPHTPETPMVTAGSAATAMVLNGLGLVNQPLYLAPMFFQNKPTQRLMAPRGDAQHLHDDTLRRILAMLYAHEVTALASLIAATAVQRLGLAPPLAHLDRTSFHVDGRDNRAAEPEAESPGGS